MDTRKLVEVLAERPGVVSRAAARRLLNHGIVEVNGEVVTDVDADVKTSDLVTLRLNKSKGNM